MIALHKKISFVLIIFLTFLIFLFIILFPKSSSCNDGTLENKCSKTIPYYCVENKLIEKASLCGCEGYSDIKGEGCLLEYSSGPKNITLYYVLNGKGDTINFTLYEGMYNYLSSLPRNINLADNLTRFDFKMRNLDQGYQKIALMPLVVEIQNRAKNKEDQVRIAISLVQNIPFGSSEKFNLVLGQKLAYQRMAYETLYEMEGVCSEKSELLVFLLRGLGYGTSFLYYPHENHEAVGIKCPEKNGINNSSFCFIETTGPSILTDNETEYLGLTKLSSNPLVIPISDGLSLGENIHEYKDAKDLITIRKAMINYNSVTWFQYIRFKKIQKKYGLVHFGEYSF